MADPHHSPSLKDHVRVMEDMYERIRIVNLRLTKQLADAIADAKHLQDAIEIRDRTIRDLKEKLKVTVRR